MNRGPCWFTRPLKPPQEDYFTWPQSQYSHAMTKIVVKLENEGCNTFKVVFKNIYKLTKLINYQKSNGFDFR